MHRLYESIEGFLDPAVKRTVEQAQENTTLDKVWPHTAHQRCWVHKTANVMEKHPKSMQPKVKEVLHNIWGADTRKKR